MYNDYPENFNLYENTGLGGNKAAKFAKKRPHQSAEEIRQEAKRQQRLMAQPIPEPIERQQRKGVKLLPSSGVGAEDKVLRGGYAMTPYGIARARLSKLKRVSRDMKIPLDQTLKLHKRIERLERAIKNRKNWGTKQEEIAYILGHLIEEGYVNSYEAAIEIAENMSDDWLYSVLYE